MEIENVENKETISDFNAQFNDFFEKLELHWDGVQSNRDITKYMDFLNHSIDMLSKLFKKVQDDVVITVDNIQKADSK